jgi:hypothetical protein
VYQQLYSQRAPRFPSARMEKPPRERPRRCQRISQIHSRADLCHQQSTLPPPFSRILVILVLSITFRQIADVSWHISLPPTTPISSSAPTSPKLFRPMRLSPRRCFTHPNFILWTAPTSESLCTSKDDSNHQDSVSLGPVINTNGRRRRTMVGT